MTNLTTCKTCGVDQIPDTWFGECKRCYDMYDENNAVQCNWCEKVYDDMDIKECEDCKTDEYLMDINVSGIE